VRRPKRKGARECGPQRLSNNNTINQELSSETDAESAYFNEIKKWIPPAEIRQGFPYYFSGYDYDGRPILVAEMGKWKWSSVFGRGANPQTERALETHIIQALYRMSILSQDSPDQEAVLVLDFDGFSHAQLGNTGYLRFLQRQLGNSEHFRGKLGYGYFVNVNFVAQTMLSFVKPMLGALFERVEIYGTNPRQWAPRLLRKIPKNQLAPWYGGSKDFKPLARIGILGYREYRKTCLFPKANQKPHSQQQRYQQFRQWTQGHLHLTPKQKAIVRKIAERLLKSLAPNIEHQLQRLGDRIYNGIRRDQQMSDEMEEKRHQENTSKPLKIIKQALKKGKKKIHRFRKG
ncbi:unnamed protein product, partial [Allacma fusca]